METSKGKRLLSDLIRRENNNTKHVVALQSDSSSSFSYVWEIKNFKNIYFEDKKFSLLSPPMKTSTDNIYFKLILDLQQGSSDAFFLLIWSADTFTDKRIDFLISIIDKDKRDRMITSNFTYSGKCNQSIICKNFVKKDLVLKPNGLLVNGSFIIKCVINREKDYFDRNPATFYHEVFEVNRSLRESEHFQELFETGKFSDIKLVVENKEFKVHKCMLSMLSPVFSAMFEHNMKEKIENLVEITDVKYEVMQEVLRYIYTRQINNFTILGKDILAVAHKYEITILQDLCEDALMNTACVENIEELLALADLFNADKLKTYVLQCLKLISKDAKNAELFKEIMDSISEPLKSRFKALH